MSDYSRGQIYVLKSNQTNDIYVGSTIQGLDVRLNKHKFDYKRYINGNYHYVSSFCIARFDDCYIELIEDYPCNSRQELLRREGEIMNNMICVNRKVEGRNREEKNKRRRNKYDLNRHNLKFRKVLMQLLNNHINLLRD